MVGTSGSSADRLLPVTPSGRNLPLLICGNMPAMPGNATITWPPSRSEVTGPLPKDTVQDALDGLTKKLNDNYPLGIHADSVEVTDAGVVGKFSSRNAAIPNEDANPCFARL